MGKMQRNKGRRGETMAKTLLTERDWTVVDLSAGCNDADLLAICPETNITYLVEVKNQKLLKWEDWQRQAIEQGNKRKLPWMLMVKLPGYNSWIIARKNLQPSIWRGREATV